MIPTVAVAISGGVDSMMAAHLLNDRGHRVIGIHFLTGFESPVRSADSTEESIPHKIRKIGKQLRIPIEIVDCRLAFKQHVVGYFIRTYYAGQTPNPCLVCNPNIKFGSVLNFARKLGANLLATGHYARIEKDRAGISRLLRGVDRHKDQSYFLARLSQSQLSRACFPLGKMKKSDVKRLANQKGLQPITRNESQDVCFIRNTSYGEFLANLTGLEPSPGSIVDRDGRILGQHRGLHRFTIGQRRGINCPAAEPYYVLRIDSKHNRLVVGSKSDLLTATCRVVEINWIHEPPPKPIEVLTRVRYRHKEAASMLSPIDKHTAEVHFSSPQSAITPGQGAVFYQGEEVLGGGFISPQPETSDP